MIYNNNNMWDDNMQRFAIRYTFIFLLVIWSAIFAGFWGVIFLGGNILQWLLGDVFGIAPDQVHAVIDTIQHVSGAGLAIIWLMGAAMLYIMKKWLWAVVRGPGNPYNVHVVNDGEVIDGTATDVTEKTGPKDPLPGHKQLH